MAKANPMRFSTKYQDNESDLLYFGFRFYNPGRGRWVNRDFAQEGGGINLYCMGNNETIGHFDALGLWGTDQHHALIDTWLLNKTPVGGIYPDYWTHYHWHCYDIDVPALLKQGSDNVDGVGQGILGFCEAQSSALSYQHSMRAYWQTVADAKSKRDSFILQKEVEATEHAVYAEIEMDGGSTAAAWDIRQAVINIGEAAHPVEDDTSPPHSGFQVWFGPLDGISLLGVDGYAAFVAVHHERETKAVYDSLGDGPANTVAAQMHPVLLKILQL
jgi:RHS repeat-associated protein